MLISEIYTGKARDGSRKAILYANEKEKLPAGSLALVAEFFRSKNIDTTIGYDTPERQP